MNGEADLRISGDDGFLAATLTGEEDLVERAQAALEDEFSDQDFR